MSYISGGGGGAAVTPGGANTDVQFNNAGSFGGDGGFTYAGNGQATLALGTITANAKALNITATWNNAGVTFDAPLSMTVTNTASNAASLLLDFVVGTSTAFGIDASGGIYMGPSNSQDMIKSTRPAGIHGIALYGGSVQTGIAVVSAMDAAGYGVTVRNDLALGFVGASNNPAGGAKAETAFWRDAANIMALGNPTTSTTAMGLRVYNTTDTVAGAPTNYERGVFDWTTSANVLTIGTQAGGTGTARNIKLLSGGDILLNNSNAGGVFTPQSGSQLTWGNAVGATHILFGAVQLGLGSQAINWTGSAGNPAGIAAQNAGITWVASKVLSFSDGTTNAAGWMQWAGELRVTSDVTYTSTTVLATVTGLSVALTAGRTYGFDVYLSFTDAAAGGIQAAMVATGGLTATAIEYDGYIIDSGANGIKGNAQAAALGGVVASATTTGTAGLVRISGTITVNVAGTLNVQAAQNTSSGTATTVKRGSRMFVYDMP